MITDDGIQLRHTAGSSWMPAMTSRACFGAAGRAASRSTSSPQGIEGLFYQPQLRWRVGLDEHGGERGAQAAAAGVQLNLGRHTTGPSMPASSSPHWQRSR
jgi:hypothetical protein